jgi:hypothetical protein
MSVSVPLTSFFNDVKICVTSHFMYIRCLMKKMLYYISKSIVSYVVNFIKFIDITLI